MLVKRTVWANSMAEWHMYVEMADDHSSSARLSHGKGRSASDWEAHLAGDVLKHVSRSFYITLQLLPKRVRGPICLGYLLARTSDTIADTESVAAAERLNFLQRFDAAVKGDEDVSELHVALQNQFQPLQTDPGETKLLDHTEEAFHWLGAVSDYEQEVTRAVLDEILLGQRLDCERFGDPGVLRHLPGSCELEEYTYLVAGSVGVFWTRLCFHHWDKFADESQETMLGWAKSYGRALQLINVLRDLPKDLENGRCYIPIPGAQEGVQPSSEELIDVSRGWEERCQEQLEEAMCYCQAVRPVRLRYATVIPLLLAERTLAYLRQASWETRKQGIKVSRDEVKTILKRGLVANLRRKRLRAYAIELREV